MAHDPVTARIRRVVHASIETAVGAAENVSGTAMLREAVRELERAEDSLLRERERLTIKRDDAAREQKSRKAKAAEMAENARYALGKDREDLATQAIAHQIDLEADADRLSVVQATCASELATVEEALAELSARLQKMRRDVADAVAVQSSGAGARSAKPAPQAKVDAAIERANSIFERATGRNSDPIRDPATARGMADIEAMKRDDEIAQRLAALRAKASTPVKRAAKR